MITEDQTGFAKLRQPCIVELSPSNPQLLIESTKALEKTLLKQQASKYTIFAVKTMYLNGKKMYPKYNKKFNLELNLVPLASTKLLQ